MKAIINTLKTIQPPRMIREAMVLYGTTEFAGPRSNSVITSWAKETKTKEDDWYNTDSIPWCGLFIAVVAQRAEKALPKGILSALSWSNFGTKVNDAILGDVLVFKRTGGGHVGLYVGESKQYYYVLGGNQSDKVCITRIAKNRIFSINRPDYNILPASAKKYYYTDSGEVSENEQ